MALEQFPFGAKSMNEEMKKKKHEEVLPKLREINSDDLKKILADHRKWVESNNKEGNRAELKFANLKRADLGESNLYEASLHRAMLVDANLTKANLELTDLAGANLQGAKLSNANLKKSHIIGADLRGSWLLDTDLRGALLMEADLSKARLIQANLNEAHLDEANFKDSYLQGANLIDARGLLAKQLSGTNLVGAKLSDDIRKFEGVIHANELVKKAGRIFTLMVVGCLFSWLTLHLTTDAQLFLNSKIQRLPIILTGLPTVGFFFVEPIILLGIYVWLHLHLQRLWEEIAELPAIFPDGKFLDQKVSPWLVTGLVRAYVPLLKKNLPDLFWLQFITSFVLVWCLVPYTISQFWARYVPSHDRLGIYVLVGMFSLSIGSGIYFFLLTRQTLLGFQKRNKIRCISLTICMVVLLAFLKVSQVSIDVTMTTYWWGFFWETDAYKIARTFIPEYDKSKKISLTNKINSLILNVSQFLGLRPYAVFINEELLRKPENWKEGEEEFPFYTGADFTHRNLRFANIKKVFMVKSSFWLSDLSYSYIRKADLRGASFSDAKLVGAAIEGNLEKANLQRANLRDAILSGNLNGADLSGANFEKALLLDVNLNHANLMGTNLQNAILDDVDFEGAEFSGTYYTAVGMQNPPGLFFTKSADGNANFSQAVLRNVKFNKANLKGVNFSQAKLFNVNLSESIGITQTQIDQTCTDEKTKLPPGLKPPKLCTKPLEN